MAPEVALTKDYSRSVDIWSSGIVMYMLLTGGEHPLFEFGKDSPEVYQQKLSKLTQLPCPSHFSGLARNLFMKLTRFNIAQRYSASDALKHPWITRLNKTNIPLTFPDKMSRLELAHKLKTVKISSINLFFIAFQCCFVQFDSKISEFIPPYRCEWEQE
jgi:serine/threonine protein kinase